MQPGIDSNKTTIVHAVDPLCHARGRRVHQYGSAISVNGWARECGVDLSRSLVRVTADDFWLPSQWDDILPAGSIVHVIPVPQGGGGSNPLQAILMVAVAVAAVYTGGLAASAFTGFSSAAAASAAGAGLTYGAVSAGVSLAVMAAGSMLINAIVPATSTNVAQGTTTSPTYALSAPGNTARLLEAIPVLYGRMKVTPDLAAQPYSEYAGNELYLYELFCISKGEIAIESILIGDTPIGSFSEITYEVIGPNQPVTLFPDNVVTSEAVSGIELQAPNDSGDWVGPFTANPAGSMANFIGVDVTLPSGLFYAADDGSFQSLSLSFEVQAQPIDDAGNPIGGWIELGSQTLTMATAQPQMITYRFPVASARYQVRARRTSLLNADSRAQNRIQWSALRGYLPSERYYGNVTLLAMRARATNSLNSATAHDVNVIATRKLPVWTGSGWSAEAQPTRSIAWAIADAARNADYSLGLSDKRIDIERLIELDAVWSARGDQFNGVFDSVGTFWDALTTLCAAGRAIPMYFGGVISIIRDEVKTVRTAIYGPGQIVAGTFEVDYGFYSEDTPDYVTVEYMDEATWTWQTVSCIPTGSPARKEKRIQMVGPTNRRQAWAEGLYKAYANRDQRKTVKATIDMAGLIPLYGDLVGISHDIPKWGIPGTVEAVDGAIVRTSQELEWTEGAQHYVYFKQADGAPTAPLRVARPVDAIDDQEFELIDALPDDFDFSDGFSTDPTMFAFGPAIDKIVQDVRLINGSPRDDKVEMTFVNNATSPHLAEQGIDPPPPTSPSLLPGIIHAPIVAEIAVDSRVVPGAVSITAAPAAGAALYECQGSIDGGGTWTTLGELSSNSLVVVVAVGDWTFRVRAYGASGLPGPFAVWAGAVDKFQYLPAAPVLTLRDGFTSDQVSVQIGRAPDVDYYHVDVVVGGVGKYGADIRDQSFDWSLALAQQWDAVSWSFDILVAGGNVEGLGPATRITLTVPTPSAPTVQQTASASSTLLTMSVPGYGRAVKYRITDSTGTIVYDGAASQYSVIAGTYRVVAYNAWGSISATTTVVVEATDPSGGDAGGG